MAHTQNAQRDASASSSHVPHESATGNAGDDLVPVQQPLSPSNHTISSVFPLFFLESQTLCCLWIILETENLKEMLSRLDQIKSIQDMLKAMNDGHGLGQRVRNETVRGNNKDAETLHCAFSEF